MNEYSVSIDGKNFRLKIGLRGLIYLQSLPNYNDDDVLVAAIITSQDLSIEDAKEIISRHGEVFRRYLPYLCEQVFSFLHFDTRDLYSQAVGEIGINPAYFFQMSPDEIDLAYRGYLRRKELEANLMKVAMVEALAGNHEKIQIVEPEEYSIGTQHERETTFNRLGREDDRL